MHILIILLHKTCYSKVNNKRISALFTIDNNTHSSNINKFHGIYLTVLNGSVNIYLYYTMIK